MAKVFKGRRVRTLKPRLYELSNADFPSTDRSLEDITDELLQLQWTVLDKNKAKNLNSALSDTDYVQKYEVLDLKRTNDGISFEIKPHMTASVKFRTASEVLSTRLDSQELQKTRECLDRAKKIILNIEEFRERLNFGLNKRS